MRRPTWDCTVSRGTCLVIRASVLGLTLATRRHRRWRRIGAATTAAATTVSASPAAAGPAAGGESESTAPVVLLRRPGFGRTLAVASGMYKVVLTVDGKDYSETIRIEPDPNAPVIDLAADDEKMTDTDEDDTTSEEGEEREEGPEKPGLP